MATWNGSPYLNDDLEFPILSSLFPSTSTASHANTGIPTVTVTKKLAIATNLFNICTNCDANTDDVSYQCRDCNIIMCHFCAKAHRRSLPTKDHKLIRHVLGRHKSNSLSDSFYSSPSSPDCPSRTDSTPSPYGPICDFHLERIKFYCHTCLEPICVECSLSDHNLHQISPYHQLLESAIATNKKLCKETLTLLTTIHRSIDEIQTVADTFNIQMQRAQIDINNLTRYLQVSLDRKRDEQVAKLTTTQRQKVDRLTNQMRNLMQMKKRAEYASKQLAITKHCTNAADMLVVNNEVSKTLALLNTFRNFMFPCENDSIDYDKRQFRELIGICNPGPSRSSASASLPHPVQVGQQSALDSFYEKIPTPATDLFAFPQSMSASRSVYGVFATVAISDNFEKIPSFFGSEGGDESQFCRPWGVCCNSLGQIIVADRSNNRIQVFDISGKFLYQFGRLGNGSGEFDRPAGVTVSPDGNIVVADKDNHRVQVFKMDGTFLFQFGERGSEDGQFNYPWDVACNILGQIAVTDTRNHRVQLFTPNGVFLNKFGFEQGMWKHFDSPRGICFTPNGHLAVTDFNNHRVLVIDRMMKKSQHFGNIGHNNSGDLLRPQGIVCDDLGRFLVADSRNHRIQIYNARGMLVGKLGGETYSALDRPSGICITPQGNVVTVDFGNSRVAIF